MPDSGAARCGKIRRATADRAEQLRDTGRNRLSTLGPVFSHRASARLVLGEAGQSKRLSPLPSTFQEPPRVYQGGMGRHAVEHARSQRADTTSHEMEILRSTKRSDHLPGFPARGWRALDTRPPGE